MKVKRLIKLLKKLDINNNYNKEKEIIIESSTIYDNKNHELWNNPNLYEDNEYLEATYYEILLVKYFKNFSNLSSKSISLIDFSLKLNFFI